MFKYFKGYINDTDYMLIKSKDGLVEKDEYLNNKCISFKEITEDEMSRLYKERCANAMKRETNN